ncbi:MAG: CYTH domain-containing protein, partial [Clostridium sp.]|nr:CYTH domain-containing protein [Clostridium sp.]
MKEIEVKVLDIDKAAVIGKLEKMGCQLVKDEAQVNTIYDFPDLRLLKKKGYARIREVRDHL